MLTCAQATETVSVLKQKHRELVLALDVALKDPAQFSKIEELSRELRNSIERCAKELTEVEFIPNFREQYHAQIDLLRESGLLQKLSNGREGIRGVDDQEYPIPNFEELTDDIEAYREIYEEKAQQGFTKLLLVPFALPLSKITNAYGKALKKKADAGQLYTYLIENSKRTRVPVTNLDSRQPVENNYVKDQSLVYYPTYFLSDSHEGLTKNELLSQNKKNGWRAVFLEENDTIPQKGQGKIFGGRKQLEEGWGWGPQDYLHFKNERNQIDDAFVAQSREKYAHEEGLTPEVLFTLALDHLAQKSEPLDGGVGKPGCYLTGCFLLKELYVLRATFHVGLGTYLLDANIPDLHDGKYGTRFAVHIKPR